MRHQVKRIMLGAGAAVSVGTALAAVQPRIVAWNTASQATLIAGQRAASCVSIDYVQANSVPVDFTSRRQLDPGTLVCDWQGRTGQINGYGAIDYVRQGQAKQINATMISRGFRNPGH